MKYVLLNLFFFLLPISSFGNSSYISNETTRQLSHKMYAFFTKTLSMNYQIQDEYELYLSFITDYNNSEYRPEMINPRILENINHEELEKIQAELFIQDSSQYFLFSESPKSGLIDSFETKNGKHFSEWNTNHKICLQADIGITDDIRSKEYRICNYVDSTLYSTGQIHFHSFSDFILREAITELHYKDIRQLIAIIFWKLLFLETGLEF